MRCVRSRTLTFPPAGIGVAFQPSSGCTQPPNLGLCRGSGVLTKEKTGWKIAQYNPSIPAPNDLANQVVKLVAASASPTVTPSTTPAHP